MICPSTKDDIQLHNMIRLNTHAEIEASCRRCGWHGQVEVSLHGIVARLSDLAEILENNTWIHGVPERIVVKGEDNAKP